MMEVYKTLQTSQDKYIYFLLATTVASIGFAITRTQNLKLSITQIPLGISVLCWGLSFFFGCRNREYYNSTLYANGELIEVQNGQHNEVGNNPLLIQAASKGIKEAMEFNSKKISSFGKLQMRMFILGTLSYIVWHVLEMYLHK